MTSSKLLCSSIQRISSRTWTRAGIYEEGQDSSVRRRLGEVWLRLWAFDHWMQTFLVLRKARPEEVLSLLRAGSRGPLVDMLMQVLAIVNQKRNPLVVENGCWSWWYWSSEGTSRLTFSGDVAAKPKRRDSLGTNHGQLSPNCAHMHSRPRWKIRLVNKEHVRVVHVPTVHRGSDLWYIFY